jgi:hypothetical protein
MGVEVKFQAFLTDSCMELCVQLHFLAAVPPVSTGEMAGVRPRASANVVEKGKLSVPISDWTLRISL